MFRIQLHFKWRNSRSSAKMEMKREMKDEGVFKHFDRFVAMLVFLYLKSMQLVTITQSQKIFRGLLVRLCFKVGVVE